MEPVISQNCPGGVFGSFNQLSSTETLIPRISWTDVGNLPVPMFGLRGVSFQNQIIVTGIRNFIWNCNILRLRFSNSLDL